MTEIYRFSGIVQGIGFRPYAKRLAIELGITGEVKNSGGDVTIIANGEKEALDEFLERLSSPFGVSDIQRDLYEDTNFETFSIVHSTNDNNVPIITPDLATCKDCEKELHDATNRRFMHPFISCVNCGPRYSIINNLPYDRENITMGKFDLCSDCNQEYTDILDRRCHAQTIACKSCGPKVSIEIPDAINLLKDGNIIAIKDIGGFHLASLANEDCASKMREIKGRDSKPFAIMFSSIEQIKEYCFVNDKEEETLLSKARPIVLLQKKKELPKGICDNISTIGAFLPCNPIQIMILDSVSPLIMTSANISGEPIIYKDETLKERFDVPMLTHDREILTPLDDSVVQIVCEDGFQFIRRARGYVPLPLDMGIETKVDTLCAGGDLKSTFCMTHKNFAYLSQYFGDLEDVACLDEYKNNIDRFHDLHSFDVRRSVGDLHPLYYSTQTVNPTKKYQHHLCHAYSVIGEHHISGNVLSFVFDGTGYGDDGAIWGSEVFINNTRATHLKYVKMPAGDETSKDANIALACYDHSNETINKAIENNINVVNSSSMGRLFDAVSAALGICTYNDYEGKCACQLEYAASKANKEYYIEESWDPEIIIKQVKEANAPKEEVALGFHLMLARLIANTAVAYRIENVTLSGGCFVNKILLEHAVENLAYKGYRVYINEHVPCTDGGISFGQAYLTALEDNE